MLGTIQDKGTFYETEGDDIPRVKLKKKISRASSRNGTANSVLSLPYQDTYAKINEKIKIRKDMFKYKMQKSFTLK